MTVVYLIRHHRRLWATARKPTPGHGEYQTLLQLIFVALVVDSQYVVEHRVDPTAFVQRVTVVPLERWDENLVHGPSLVDVGHLLHCIADDAAHECAA